MFRVGQKVVCVDDSPTTNVGDIRELNKIVVYTVRWCGHIGKISCVRLAEIQRRRIPIPHPDYPFRASRFRPIVERKTDISIFTEMLRRESAPSSLPLAEA